MATITSNQPLTDDSWLDKTLTPEEDAALDDDEPGFLSRAWDATKYYGGDILGSIGRGAEENIASYPGAPGDLYDLAGAGSVVANKWAGATPEMLDAQRKSWREDKFRPPNTEKIMDTPVPVELGGDGEPLLGDPGAYEPKTAVGSFLRKATSMIGPRGLRHLVTDVALPMASTELAAEVARREGLDAEEAQLLTAGAGLGSPIAAEGGKRGVTRVFRGPTNPEAATSMRTLQGVDTPLTPEMPNERNERMRRLQDEGIEVTGGQALGSDFVKRVEAGPFAGRSANVNEAQARQITRAALRRVGIDADRASPEIMAAAQERFGQDYQTLVQQNNGVVMDQTLQNTLLDIGTNFEDLRGTATGTPIGKFFNRIVDAAAQHGGVIPPDVFNAIHSELAATIRRTNGVPELSTMNAGLREMQDALYETIGRNGQPEIEAAARDLNNRYRNFKIVEKSVGGAGEGASFGFVSPAKLRAELERRDPTGYAQGRGDLTQLARDLQSLVPLEVSGTGAQRATSSIPEALKALSIAIPSAVVSTRPVQTSIVNRATGVNPAWAEPMSMPPILGFTQRVLQPPAPVEPQEDPQKQSMLGNDYPIPVDLVDPQQFLRGRGIRYG